MPAPPRNRFAAKPQDQQHSETLYVRLKKQDKERIVEAAGDTGIAAWVRGVLLSAVASKCVKAAKTVQRTGASRLGPSDIPTPGAAGSRR
jgi:hypothetical protein